MCDTWQVCIECSLIMLPSLHSGSQLVAIFFISMSKQFDFIIKLPSKNLCTSKYMSILFWKTPPPLPSPAHFLQPILPQTQTDKACNLIMEGQMQRAVQMPNYKIPLKCNLLQLHIPHSTHS